MSIFAVIGGKYERSGWIRRKLKGEKFEGKLTG
jgi:hypothetical protein